MDNTTLEQFCVTNQLMVDTHTLRHSLELSQHIDNSRRALVISLRGYVLAEEVDNRTKAVTFKTTIPATWWDHLKQDKLPYWLTKLFPIKLKTIEKSKKVTFRRLATYPKANIVLPELGSTIVYRNQLYEE